MSQDLQKKIDAIKSELAELGEKKREKLEELRKAEKELRTNNKEQNRKPDRCSYCGAKKVYARILCCTCYERFLRNGTPDYIKKVKKIPPPAIPWQDVLFEKVFGAARSESDTPKPDDYNESVEIALSTLDDRSADAVKQKLRDGKTLQEIGECFGVTRERARQIIAASMRKLKRPCAIKYLVYGVKKVTEIEADRIAAEEKEKQKVKAEYEERFSCKKEASETDINILGLSTRSYNAMWRSGIETVSDVLNAIKNGELPDVRNLGVKSIEEIKTKVTQYIKQNKN